MSSKNRIKVLRDVQVKDLFERLNPNETIARADETGEIVAAVHIGGYPLLLIETESGLKLVPEYHTVGVYE